MVKNWQINFDLLTEEFGEWSDARDFPEDLRADELLSLWGREMPAEDRRFLEDFIDRWYLVAAEMEAAEVCGECRRYTPHFKLKPFAGRDLCPSCHKSEKERKPARNVEPGGIIIQASLFS